jgi:hypothetical protein
MQNGIDRGSHVANCVAERLRKPLGEKMQEQIESIDVYHAITFVIFIEVLLDFADGRAGVRGVDRPPGYEIRQ